MNSFSTGTLCGIYDVHNKNLQSPNLQKLQLHIDSYKSLRNLWALHVPPYLLYADKKVKFRYTYIKQSRFSTCTLRSSKLGNGF